MRDPSSSHVPTSLVAQPPNEASPPRQLPPKARSKRRQKTIPLVSGTISPTPPSASKEETEKHPPKISKPTNKPAPLVAPPVAPPVLTEIVVSSNSEPNITTSDAKKTKGEKKKTKLKFKEVLAMFSCRAATNAVVVQNGPPKASTTDAVEDELLQLENEDLGMEFCTFFTACEESTSVDPQQLVRCLNQDYTDMLLQASKEINTTKSEHGYYLESHLKAATHLQDQFVACCNSNRTALLAELCQIVDDYLYPRLVDQYRSMNDNNNSLVPMEAAKCILWMERWQLKSSPFLTTTARWREEQETLVQLYLQRAVRNPTRDILSRCLDQYTDDEAIHRRTDGHLHTCLPETIDYLYQQQRDAALKSLPQRYHVLVKRAANNALVRFCGSFMATEWQDAHRYCALVNDLARLAEQCERRNDAYDDEEGDDAIETTLTQFSLKAIDGLAECIFQDLQSDEDPILNSVGTRDWESQTTASPVQTTILTLEDYFPDIEQWLDFTAYYFPKALKRCLDMTVEIYLQSFFRNTMENGIDNPAVAAKQMHRDHMMLRNFFCGPDFKDYHGLTGFYTVQETQDRLAMLEHCACLVDPKEEPNDVVEHVQAIIQILDQHVQGTPAVLHLVGLRKRHGKKESIEWLQVIAKAKKAMEIQKQGGFQEESNLCHYVPNLNDSKFLHNVRADPGVQRKLSTTTQELNESTSQLLRDEATGLDFIRYHPISPRGIKSPRSRSTSPDDSIPHQD